MERPRQFMQDSDFVHAPAVKHDKATHRFMEDRGYVSPDFVLIEVTEHKGEELPQWWGLDDVVKYVANSKGFNSLKIPGSVSWNIVPADTLHELKGLFMDMGVAHRLRVGELPTPGTISTD
jgi:hypothetical protein